MGEWLSGEGGAGMGGLVHGGHAFRTEVDVRFLPLNFSLSNCYHSDLSY